MLIPAVARGGPCKAQTIRAAARFRRKDCFTMVCGNPDDKHPGYIVWVRFTPGALGLRQRIYRKCTVAEQSKKTESPEPQLEPKDLISVTKHEIKINGKLLKYTVSCGTVVLKEEQDKDGAALEAKPRASMFFVSYTLDSVKDPAKRPITYSFNGGPGSSSVWLHLGLLGPKRVKLDLEGNAGAPPYALIDNEFSLLDKTDLVFIDPIGTGYSRMVSGEKVGEFHDYKRDLESVGEFIRLYTSRNQRWASPKYIAGESYGTTRACGLAGLLQEKHGMYFNGLLLISCAMDFQTLRFDHGNDLPPVLFLPTYTATAWYHQALAPAEQKRKLVDLLKEVETFAAGEYSAALFAGSSLGTKERAGIVEKLARYTGLSPEYVEATNLRINIHRYCKELLRSRGQVVGRLDSRFKNKDRDNAGELGEFDPAQANLKGAYSSLMNNYVQRDLKFQHDLPYTVSSMLWMTWGWNEFANRYANVAETLRKAMRMNTHLKVYVANGYFDLATPHFATDYTFNHLNLDESRMKDITTHYYEAGHMMYIHEPSLKAMASDMRAFIDSK
jgi:carboxypeptidase C (cathepsin A)